MTIPPKVFRDLVDSFPRKPFVYVCEGLPGNLFADATIPKINQRIVALSQELYRRVNNDLRMRTNYGLEERATVRFSPMMSGDSVVVATMGSDVPGHITLALESLDA